MSEPARKFAGWDVYTWRKVRRAASVVIPSSARPRVSSKRTGSRRGLGRCTAYQRHRGMAYVGETLVLVGMWKSVARRTEWGRCTHQTLAEALGGGNHRGYRASGRGQDQDSMTGPRIARERKVQDAGARRLAFRITQHEETGENTRHRYSQDPEELCIRYRGRLGLRMRPFEGDSVAPGRGLRLNKAVQARQRDT